MNHLYDALRAATEDDVDLVVGSIERDGLFQINAPAVDLLEFFNRMQDELTGERASAEEMDDLAVAEAAARAAG